MYQGDSLDLLILILEHHTKVANLGVSVGGGGRGVGEILSGGDAGSKRCSQEGGCKAEEGLDDDHGGIRDGEM